MEIDVSAHAPRMQKTLLELNFLPVAYIPAMVFHDVERLDIVRMARLNIPPDLGPTQIIPPIESIVQLVMRGFTLKEIAPRIAQVASEIPLFSGLNEEQLTRLARSCSVTCFKKGDRIFQENEKPRNMYIILDGRVSIQMGALKTRIGIVKKGETLGELSLLSFRPHSASAVAETAVEAVSLHFEDLSQLIRLRPDIGVAIYRSLASGLGEKLLRSDLSLIEQLEGKMPDNKLDRPPKRQL